MNIAPTKFTFRCKSADHNLYTANLQGDVYVITWLDSFGKQESTTYQTQSVEIFLQEKASWMTDRRPAWIIKEIIES